MAAVLEPSSTLHSVVVYASGALCTRRARVVLPGGSSGSDPMDRQVKVRLRGLPLVLDARSLRARVRNGPADLRVVDVRREVETGLPDPADLSPFRQALEAAEDAADAARAARETTSAQVAHVAALRAVPPTARRGEPPRRAPVDALLALAEFVDARLAVLQRRLIAAEDAVSEAERRADLARRELREASGALPTEPVRNTSTVLLTLDLGEHPPAELELDLELEYGVPGATWTPSYELRLTDVDGDAAGGTLAMRAMIAQRTGEDWTGVRIGLSTADLRRRTDAPELRSLRIGRKQAEPVQPLRREPPSGLPDLFTGYDGFLRPEPAAPRPVMRAMHATRKLGGPAQAAADSAEGGYGGPPPPSPPPIAQAAPAAAPMRSAGFAAMPPAPGGPIAFGAAPPARSAPQSAPMPPAPPEAPRDYAELTLAGAAEPAHERGRLLPSGPGRDAVTDEYRRRAEAVSVLALPAHCRPVRSSAGSFDYRYDATAPVDVPADGSWHTVPVRTFPVTLAPEHVCVPAADPRVYAAVRLGNTSGHALLAGPADVSVDGGYLMTTQLPTLAPGQHRRVGIGVVESIQVARNTQMRESTSGLRGGTLVLEHRVEVELANRLGRPVTVEVRERVPVSDDKDARVEEQPATPPWTAVPPEQDIAHRRGMRVWRVTLEPRATTRLTGAYEIRIPTAKALSDGNRRH